MAPSPRAARVAPSPLVVFVAAYATLACLVVLQVAVSNSAMGVPLHLPSFLAVRAAEAAIGLVVYVPLLLLVRRVADIDRVGFARHLAVALALVTPVAFAVAASPVAMRAAGIPIGFKGSLFGKGVSELVVTGLALALAVAVDVHRRYREREAQALLLEARLAEARLQALSSQLHPHFLFNTLNAIAVILHRDPRAADAMLVGLADLLRATLRERHAHEIPLSEELALLDRYLEIMRHRYGARLTTEVKVADDAGELLVPPFVLQPLVENALEHGIGRRAGPGTVRVLAARAGDRLRLEVADDGAGIARDCGASDDGDGIGLSTTRRRLEQLYGAAQRLVLESGADGHGARAVVELPARTRASAPA